MLRYGAGSQTQREPHNNLLTSVKRRKLKYWHVATSIELAKTTIPFPYMGREGEEGRKWWENNITEWTGKTQSDNLRRVED